MFEIEDIDENNIIIFYEKLNKQLEALISEENDWLANISNAAALLYVLIPDINWAGFYFNKSGELVLGPFQGKPACIRIKRGRGVCGTAAKERKTQIVMNVQELPGHIACDENSMSEVVVPIIKDDSLIGVLDIDSPTIGRFNREHGRGLEMFVDTLNKYIKWPKFCE